MDRTGKVLSAIKASENSVLEELGKLRHLLSGTEPESLCIREISDAIASPIERSIEEALMETPKVDTRRAARGPSAERAERSEESRSERQKKTFENSWVETARSELPTIEEEELEVESKVSTSRGMPILKELDTFEDFEEKSDRPKRSEKSRMSTLRSQLRDSRMELPRLSPRSLEVEPEVKVVSALEAEGKSELNEVLVSVAKLTQTVNLVSKVLIHIQKEVEGIKRNQEELLRRTEKSEKPERSEKTERTELPSHTSSISEEFTPVRRKPKGRKEDLKSINTRS